MKNIGGNSMSKRPSKIRNFRDLDVWRTGHEFVVLTYTTTQYFPASETYGLTNQMRRAAVSLTSNIAEGFSRQSVKEKIQYYFIAQGSVTELQNQIHVALDVGYISNNQFETMNELLTRTQKMLHRLIQAVRAKN